MKVLITSKVNGVDVTTDYTHYVLDGSITVEDSVNVPTLTSFQLCNIDDAFVLPPRGSYVEIISEIYTGSTNRKAGQLYLGEPVKGYFMPPSGGNAQVIYSYPTNAAELALATAVGQSLYIHNEAGLTLQWFNINPDGTSGGSYFNPWPGSHPGVEFLATTSLYVQAAGTYNLQVTYQDGYIFAINGATVVSAPVLNNPIGQTVTPIAGYSFANSPGVRGTNVMQGFFTSTDSYQIYFPEAGLYPMEFGWGNAQPLVQLGTILFTNSLVASGNIQTTVPPIGPLATGFITDVGERVYMGLSNKVGNFNNQVYTYNINVTSDEWLLNCQAIPYIPAFVNQTDSQILAGIAEALMPGFYDTTSMMASGNLIPYYQYDPTQTWSNLAKTFGDQNRYHYKCINKQIIYQPFGDEPLGIAYDDQNQKEGFLSPYNLTTPLITVPPVNDCTVIGDIEPQTNWNNYFCGDGFTSNFQLRHQVFEGTSSNLLQDDWTESSFTQGTWTVNDPAGIFVLADGNGNALGALNVVQKGQTSAYQPQVDAEYILAQNGLELGGGLNLQHGSVTFNDTASGGGGIIGGIFGTSTFTPGTCLAGFGVSGQPNIGTFEVISVEIVNGNTQLVSLTINGTVPTDLYPGNVFSCASFTNATFLNGTDQTVVSATQNTGNYTIVAQGGFTYNNPYGPTTDSGEITFASNQVFVTASGAAGIVIQPIYNGQYVGTPVVTQVNHQYLLQTWIGAGAQTRYTRPYTNLTQTATYGAQNLAASGTISWVITDVALSNYVVEEQDPLFGLFPSAPPPVVVQYSQFNVDLPPFALYCLVNAVDLNVSINYTDLSLPPQGYLTVQSLTGMSGGNLPWHPYQLSQPIVYQLGFGQDNQTAQISAQGEAYSLSFYTDDIPSVGARIVFQSWSAGQSVARVQDTVAIANEAQISGDSGIRSAIMTNLSPLPRTSDECEAAAAAAILDNEYPQFQGTYTIQTIPYKFENLLAPSIYGYPMTGRFLYVNSPIRAITGQNFYVNTCRFNVLELKQEVLSVSLDYGMDLYLEKLLPAFLESPVTSTILAPTQTVPPPNPITLPQVLNATLPTLDNASVTAIVNSLTGNYIEISLGAPPVSGCEVRSVDSGWGVADQGRVGLFTNSTFTVPRTARDQTWYLRTLNGSIYSRFSKALRVVYPLIPSAPTLVNANAQAIVFDYAGDVRDIYGLELRATPVSGVEFVEFPDVPEDQFAQLTRSNLEVPTDAQAAGLPVKNNGNVIGIYNPPMNSVPFPFAEQFELGDVIYVVCPVDQSFAGVQLVTNILTATGNSGVILPQTLSFTNAVGFFMPNPNNFNGAFAYGYPLASSVAGYGSSIDAIVSLGSLEFNYGKSVGGQLDPNVQPIVENNYDSNGNYLGSTIPWSGATQGWAMAVTGNLVFPTAGQYKFSLVHDDGAYWGIGGSATKISGPGIINSNPTLAVTNIPVMGGNNQSTQHNGGNVWIDVFVIEIPSAGAYPFEINYAQWYNEQTLFLLCNNASIFPGTEIPAASGAPWGIGWFDYGEPFPDQQGSAVYGTDADIATVQLYNRGASTVCASGAISGAYTGTCTVWTTPNPHNFSPGQQFIMGAGWQTFPLTGYPALPNTGSVFCGLWNVTSVLDAYTFQFTNTTLANPNLTPGTSAQVIAQLGVTPQHLNGLVAPMPTPFNLPASSGIIIQRPVFAPSDLVIDLTQPDIAETFGILQALSPGGRIQGLTAYFFNLTWDYSYGTVVPSFQVPALTGVFIDEQTQQVSWNLSVGSPDGYRVDITDPNTGQLYNQFTIDHPYNPLLLTQFQMSNVDFSQNRNITITPFDIAGDGIPITVYHPGGTITLGIGGGNGSTATISFGCTWQGALSPASGVILHIPLGLGVGSVTLPLGLSGSAGHLLKPPQAPVTIPIFRNGVQFGSMNFATGQQYATFTSSVQVFNPPLDYITVALPNTPDNLASDLGFMIVGYVGLP